MVLGCLCVFALIWLDGRNRAALAKDASGLATFSLFFQTALTFGAVSMGLR